MTANSETEWSKEFPREDGDYLCRINEQDLRPVSFRIESGTIYEYGYGKNLRSDYYRYAGGFEFLGPFTWQDLEQLIRLRKAAGDALRFMEWNADPTANEYPKDLPMGYDVIAALREALALTGEQS